MGTPLTLEDGSTALTLEDGSTALTLEDDVTALGFASETDSALSTAAAKSATAGQVVETDSAFPVTLAFVAGPALETSSALALLQGLGQAAESDTALPLDVLTHGYSIPLSAGFVAAFGALPVVVAAGPEWLVRITRRPAMTVTEEIIATVDAEDPRTYGEFHNEPANELGQFGFSTFVVDALDIAVGDLVEFYDRGLLIGGGVIRQEETLKVGRRVEGKPRIDWRGVRPLGILEEGFVLPVRGEGSTAQDRTWGWFAPGFPRPTWIPANEIVQGNASHWADDGAGEGFADDTAFWVWARRRAGDPSLLEWAPDGTCLFAQTGTVPAGITLVEIEYEGDAIAEAYFEGEALPPAYYPDRQTARKEVLPGAEILFAAAITNDVDPEGDEVHNPGGGKWAIWSVNPTTGKRDTVIMHSDSSAVMLEYVTVRPGVSPAEPLLQCLAENQFLLGLCLGVTPTFTAELDSAGHPWAEVGEIGTKVGYSLWKLTQQLISVYIDSDLNPATREWHAWSKGTRGHATTVAYTDTGDPDTSNLQEHTFTRSLMRGNDILSYSKFGWHIHRSGAGGLRIGATLGLGTLPSFDEVQRWAGAELTESSENRVEHDVKILPTSDADTPYWAYGIGDSVFIDDDAQPVASIEWHRDENGRIHWNEEPPALDLDDQLNPQKRAPGPRSRR